MSDFLDNLLSRNLPATKTDRPSHPTQGWVRPRARSLFESTSAGIVTSDSEDPEALASVDGDATPHSNSRTRTGRTALHIDRDGAASDGASSAQHYQDIDRARNSEYTRITAPTSILNAAFPPQLSAERGAFAPTARVDDTTRNAVDSFPRGSDNVAEAADTDRRLRPWTAQLRPMIGTTERNSQPLSHSAQHLQREQLTSQPTGRPDAHPRMPPPLPALNAVTPPMLDRGLRSRLQALAAQAHNGKSPRVPIEGNTHRTEHAPQTIQVSIGRIDIRATGAGAAAVSPPRKEKSLPQALALDDYLRQRAGGGRE